MSNTLIQPLRKRSLKTEEAYEKRVRQLYAASEKNRTTDPQDPAIVGPEEVLTDFLSTAHTLGKASWNLYRSALLWHFSCHRNQHHVYETAYIRLRSTKRPTESASHSPSSKQRNARHIPEKDFDKLIDMLGGMNRTTCWGARVQYWLYATLATGLRPNEWKSAKWTDETKTAITADNSKIKEAPPAFQRAVPGKSTVFDEPDEIFIAHDLRSTGKNVQNQSNPTNCRTIPVPEKYKLHVEMHLILVSENIERFEKYYNNCRAVLLRACKRTFKNKKNYSLYTMRGQFAANAKATHSLEKVRELMGHTDSTGRTTMRNYGKRRHAFRGEGPAQAAEKEQQSLPNLGFRPRDRSRT